MFDLEQAINKNRQWQAEWRSAVQACQAGEITVDSMLAKIRDSFRATGRVYSCPKCRAEVRNPDAKMCPNRHRLAAEWYLPWGRVER